MTPGSTRTRAYASHCERDNDIRENEQGQIELPDHDCESEIPPVNKAEDVVLPSGVKVGEVGGALRGVNAVKHIGKDGDDEDIPGHDTLEGNPQPTQRYSSFSKGTRRTILLISALAAIFAPISSSIFVPAIPLLAQEFNRSEQDISLAVTIYLVFMALAPPFFGSISDTYGRRPVYIGTLLLYVISNIGLALVRVDTYWLFMVLRALQATGGAPVIAVGAGCVSDIAAPRERGFYMSVLIIGAMLGTAIGPLLGGVLAQTLGWRWIFWAVAIISGAVLVPLIIFLPETLRSAAWYAYKAKGQGDTGTQTAARPSRREYRPLAAFAVLRTPEVTLVFVFVSMIFLEYFAMLTIFSTALKEVYGLNELQIGLCYLPAGAGTCISVLGTGRLTDWSYRREARRVQGDYADRKDEFRLERARLPVGLPSVLLFGLGCIALGWSIQLHAPLAVVLVAGFFTGMATPVISLATVYGQDLCPGQGSSVSASLNVLRCLFAASGTAHIQLLYRAFHPGWTFMFLTAICGLSALCPWLVHIRGAKWRDRRSRENGLGTLG